MGSRHSGGSDSWLAIVVLALVAILGGLVYAFWDKIKGLGQPEVATVERPPPPAPKVTPRAKPPKIGKPEPVVAKPPPRPRVEALPLVSDSRKERAGDLHRQGEAALAALDFDLAAKLFGNEADLLGRDRNAASRARGFRAKAETFSKVIAGVELNPEAKGDLVTLKRHSGVDVADVVLVEETQEAYVIKLKNGITVEVPRRQVIAVKRASPEEKRARLVAAFEKVERKNRGASGVDHYLVAEYAYKDGLKEKALEYLEKAYEKDGSKLPGKVRIHAGKKLLGVAIWFASTGRTSQVPRWCRRVEREFSDVPELVAEARDLRERMAKPVAVANYRSTVKIKTRQRRAPRPSRAASSPPPSPQDEEVTVDAATVSSRSGRNAKLVGNINTLFKQGMDHYVAGRPGNPNSNMHLSKAAKLFDQVSQLCDQALRNDPGNSQLESRQADATRYSYHAKKMKTLGMFGR